jgi:hypothetical protein
MPAWAVVVLKVCFWWVVASVVAGVVWACLPRDGRP